MCGIFGLIRCANARNPERASAAFVELGHLSIERGRDAAGFALTSCDNKWVNDPTYTTANSRHTVIDDVTVIKDTCSFDDLWDDDKHLPLLASATVALGHTRWATQGKRDALVNASPLVVGSLIGTHNGDIDVASIPGQRTLGLAVGTTDTERLYQALNRDRKDRRKVVTDLTEVEGRAALAWIDRYRPDRVYLARAALSPLSIAFDADGNLYWASNPNWFRKIDAKFNGAIGFHNITMVREGTLLTINVGEDKPYIEDMRTFTPQCRPSDARLSDGVIWRGFADSDIKTDKAQVTRKVAPSRWKPSTTWKSSTPSTTNTTNTTGKAAASAPAALPAGSGTSALPDYADSLYGLASNDYQAAPGQRTLDEALAAEQPEMFDWSALSEEDLVLADEVETAVITWAEEGYSMTVVERLQEARTPSEQTALSAEFGFSDLRAYAQFKQEVLEWVEELSGT